MTKKMLKVLGLVAVVMLLSGIYATSAHASVNRGNLEIALNEANVTLEADKTATVTADAVPLQDNQLPGCGMPQCPQTCHTGCLANDGINCTCAGTTFQTYTTGITASSSNSGVAVATVVYGSMQVTITGVAAGTATITVTGHLKEWTDDEKQIAVTVTANSASSGPSGGNNGGTSSGPSGGPSGGNNGGTSSGPSGGTSGGNNGGTSSGTSSGPSKGTCQGTCNCGTCSSGACNCGTCNGTCSSGTCSSSCFTDVPANYWAAAYINNLVDKGIIKGKTATTFAPDDPITRAEFVAILAGVAGANVKTATGPTFSDVAPAAWYAPYVAWAGEVGIAKGENGQFNPDAQISRQDIAAMLASYVQYIAKKTLPAKNSAISFNDEKSISAYAKDAVSMMQQDGIIDGYANGDFLPANSATRAEAAKMISALMDLLSKK